MTVSPVFAYQLILGVDLGGAPGPACSSLPVMRRWHARIILPSSIAEWEYACGEIHGTVHGKAVFFSPSEVVTFRVRGACGAVVPMLRVEVACPLAE